jgi:hypothetical protein
MIIQKKSPRNFGGTLLKFIENLIISFESTRYILRFAHRLMLDHL